MNIKEWYKTTYKDDELGDRINEVSWNNLWKGLCSGAEVYDIIGVADTIIRERLFEKLANNMGVPYDVVFYTWLGGYQEALQNLMK